jgi:hypothetical protein
MTAAGQHVPLGCEFDKFLFTALGDDQNGLPLSVVSLLARMNLDPWVEAGALAALPAEAAARRLAGSLDALTDPLLRQTNSETTIRRLLALLPRPGPAAAPTLTSSSDTSAPEPRSHIRSIVFIASTLALIVGSQILIAHRHVPVQSATGPSPASLRAPPQSVPTPPSP